MRFIFLIAILLVPGRNLRLFSDEPLMERTGKYEAGKYTISLEEISKRQFDAAIDLDVFNAYNPDADSGKYYFQHDSTLVLKLENGKTKSYVSDKDGKGDDYAEYYYGGRLGKKGYYFVWMNGNEVTTHILIDKKTGVETFLWSSPSLSPDEKFVLCDYAENQMDGIPGGIQLWDFETKNEIQPIFEMRCNKWSPRQIKWIDAKTALIEQGGAALDTNDTVVHYVRMSILETDGK